MDSLTELNQAASQPAALANSLCMAAVAAVVPHSLLLPGYARTAASHPPVMMVWLMTTPKTVAF
jgi:hypothetical protein